MMGILGCFLGRLLVVPYKQIVSNIIIIIIIILYHFNYFKRIIKNNNGVNQEVIITLSINIRINLKFLNDFAL